MAANSRNSAWAAYDGRNRREIKQGDRYVCLYATCSYSPSVIDAIMHIQWNVNAVKAKYLLNMNQF